MDRIKLSGYLNIARKANYIIIGGENLYKYSKKLYLVLYDMDIKKNTTKVLNKLVSQNIPTIQIDNLEQLSTINNCKILGIKNKALSDIIKNIIEK